MDVIMEYRNFAKRDNWKGIEVLLLYSSLTKTHWIPHTGL